MLATSLLPAATPPLATTLPELPLFASRSTIGRRARLVDSTCVNLIIDGRPQKAFNIIPKLEIEERIYAFCKHVLNPVLKGSDATFVPILNGAFDFMSAINAHVDEAAHVEVMSMYARSYGTGETSGPVFVSKDLIIPNQITGRTLVILDDVLETGNTVSEVIKLLNPHKPARIITAFLLRKQQPTPPSFTPDYWLFDVHPSSWVFGFGMDLKKKYRHLRYICDAKSQLYRNDGTPIY